MLTACLLAVATGFGAGPAGSDDLKEPPPPTDAVPLPASPLPPLPAAVQGANRGGKPAPPTLALQESNRTLLPRRGGAGIADGARIRTKSGRDKITATLLGAAYAHSSIRLRSDAAPVIRLVQVFDVVPGGKGHPGAKLTLSGTLDGYVRCESGGAASLHAAGARVYPVGSETPVASLDFPPAHTPGAGAWRCEQTAEAPASVVPEGRYVLVVDLAPRAHAEGFCGAHAEAVFTPDPRLGTWSYPPNPLAKVDGKSFGLVVTMKVAAP